MTGNGLKEKESERVISLLYYELLDSTGQYVLLIFNMLSISLYFYDAGCANVAKNARNGSKYNMLIIADL